MIQIMAVIWASVLYFFVFEIAMNYYFLIKKLIKIVPKKKSYNAINVIILYKISVTVLFVFLNTYVALIKLQLPYNLLI